MVPVRLSREKSIITSLIVALLHSCLSNANQEKIDYNLTTFYKQYFRSKFNVFLMVQIRPSQEKKQSSFHSLLHFCTPAKTLQSQQKSILILFYFINNIILSLAIRCILDSTCGSNEKQIQSPLHSLLHFSTQA